MVVVEIVTDSEETAPAYGSLSFFSFAAAAAMVPASLEEMTAATTTASGLSSFC